MTVTFCGHREILSGEDEIRKRLLSILHCKINDCVFKFTKYLHYFGFCVILK